MEDVERLFGEGVINFMDQHGYHNEATYLRKVRNWRRAVDERGLSDAHSQQFCTELHPYRNLAWFSELGNIIYVIIT